MKLGRYILSPLIVTTVIFGSISAARDAKTRKRGWRRYLVWAGWALSLALAVGEVASRVNTGNSKHDENSRNRTEKHGE